MNLLITGGSSYLGQHLVPLAQPHHAVTYTYFTADPLRLEGAIALDLRDAAAVHAVVERQRPAAIIHLAGSNRSPDMVNLIVSGARNIVASARTVGAKVVHLSSDVIFRGEPDENGGPPYDESAPPAPVHAYGHAKAEAEAILATYPNHVIVRTSLIYSLRLIDNGTRWMRQAVADGTPPTLFNNHLRNPIHAGDLSMACLELAQNDVTGIINLVGSQSVVRADFARRLLAHWGVPTDTIADAPDLSGRFPRDLRMRIDRAQALLQTHLRGVDDVFATRERAG